MRGVHARHSFPISREGEDWHARGGAFTLAIKPPLKGNRKGLAITTADCKSPDFQTLAVAIRRAKPDWDQAQVDRAVSTILEMGDAEAQRTTLLAITASDEEWAADRAAHGGGASSSGGA